MFDSHGGAFGVYGSIVPRFLRVPLATLSTYLLGPVLVALGVVIGCLASLVRWWSFIRVGSVVWGMLQFWIVGRHPRVIGRENLRPGSAFLVIANHSSMFDIAALMAAVPGVAIMGRDYLTRIPGFGLLLKVLHYIPIDTTSGRSSREALHRAAGEIRTGTTVGMFAEGTRTQTGQVQPLKRGFVSVLRESGADLIPVYIRGTFALRPKGTLLVDPREPVSITVGKPVAHAHFAGLDDPSIMQNVRSLLQSMAEEKQ
jgi:1-acyl-sn-glycerol-3-phosphate acyltransferase